MSDRAFGVLVCPRGNTVPTGVKSRPFATAPRNFLQRVVGTLPPGYTLPAPFPGPAIRLCISCADAGRTRCWPGCGPYGELGPE